MAFVSFWAYLRYEYEDDMCWTTSKNWYVSLLVQMPIEISMIVSIETNFT